MTAKERILQHLLAGYTINNLIAMKEYGTWSLPYHIFSLRREGYEIKTRMKETFSGKRYAEYYMPMRARMKAMKKEGVSVNA